MKRVVIESPFAGDQQRNTAYARACLKDSLRRGEAPFASHLLYTQCLDDDAPDDRRRGISAGFEWGRIADLVAVYTDLGISKGMQQGIDRAFHNRCPAERRSCAADLLAEFGVELPERS